MNASKSCAFCAGDIPSKRPEARYCSRSCAGKGTMAVHARRGEANNRYNGGLSTSKGRTIVVLRDGSNQLYSRALMEGHLKRHLRPDEIVHHVNEDPADDRIENLKVVTRAEHMELHRAALAAARKTFHRGDDHWSHRMPERRTRGEKHGNAKLTDDQVVAIRAEHAETGISGAQLGRRYGVARGTINAILRGETRV